MKTIMTVLAGLAVCSAMLMAGGCSSGNRMITSESFRSNPSPELYSYGATKEQYQNDRALVIDQNTRQIPDDINSLLLLDQPMHFSTLPMP